MAAWGYEFYLLVLNVSLVSPSGHVISSMSNKEELNLLIGQLMSDNLLYRKSLLNPFIYAWRLRKYREAFYKSVYRKKAGKYSGETKSATGTRSRRELVEVSSFTSNAVSFSSSQSVITLLSFKELEK